MMSRPVVHPVDLLSTTNDAAAVPTVRMEDFQGMDGTPGGLLHRFQITSTLTFAAACASAGITVLISNDLDKCNMNHCKRFMSDTALAFLSWFAMSPSFFFSFWNRQRMVCIVDRDREVRYIVSGLSSFSLPASVFCTS